VTEIARSVPADPLAKARMQWFLRFGTGVSATYVLGEALGWSPAYLPPLFTAMLLSHLPGPLPPKFGLVLIAAVGIPAAFAYFLSVLLVATPAVLFGCAALVIFIAYNTMAHGRAVLPMTFLLITVTLVPINTVVSPAHADVLPLALTKGMAVAVIAIWILFALWPERFAAKPQLSTADVVSPTRVALVGTAILAPLLLAFMLYGQNHATPVITTTVLLVAQFEVQHGAVKGFTRVIGALIGGFMGAVAYMLLGIAPSLMLFAVLVFLLATLIAPFIARGGVIGASAQMTCNSFFAVFGSALSDPDTSAGTWATRFTLMLAAWLFAVGMMILFLPRPRLA